MNQKTIEQLDKVLALAESDHDGEALGALRMVRRMLTREGISFTDLAQAAKKGDLFSRSFFSGDTVQLEAKVDQLYDEINAHVEQNVSLTNQIEHWRRRAFELEQMLVLNQAETTRWKEMARETAERLWDLGQMARADAFLSDVAAREDSDVQAEPLQAAG